jgi:hypothetical protein
VRRSTFPIVGSALVTALALVSGPLNAQRGGMFLGSPDDPAIAYTTAPLQNVVVDVNRRLLEGTLRLQHDGRSGYLQSALEALNLSVDSQMLVFSRTSLQARLIDEKNPRALFFNDRVALGWVRDGEVIEVAAHDAKEGIVFYELDQKPADGGAPPQFRREFRCLACHLNGDTLGVPGLLMFSTASSPDGRPTRAAMMDHRTPLASRYGGWFVTGTAGAGAHQGNAAAALGSAPPREVRSVEGLFDPDGYRTMSSDIAPLLVLSHQVHMTNLLTRVGWEARAADPTLHPPFVAAPGEEERIAHMMSAIATEVVDYLLFVDEAPLPGGVRGSSGFAERFSGLGPRDKTGRSLRELDLTRRLMKYPCSYLIYSPAFDALPPAARDPIYRRMWTVLSGQEADPRYRAALPFSTRRAIVEILRDTKPDLPGYFTAVTN